VCTFTGIGDEHSVQSTDVKLFVLASTSNEREMAASRYVISHRLPKLCYNVETPHGNFREIGKVVNESRNNLVSEMGCLRLAARYGTVRIYLRLLHAKRVR
jgi:hypothetical protein